MDHIFTKTFIVVLASVAVVAIVLSSLGTVASYQLNEERQQAVQGETVDVKSLRDDITKTLDCHANPGLAVSIVKDGKTVLSDGFGVTNPATKIPVSSSTLFSIASLTKAFTAALMVNAMAENGSTSLSSLVKDVIGGDFRFNESQRTEYATIEDLLTHRLAVPSNSEFRFNPQIDRHQVLKRIRYFPTNSLFRVKASYSSTNYVMAAAITELISGRKWEELMRDHIFFPLGMIRTSFADDVTFDDSYVASPFGTLDGTTTKIDPRFTKQWDSFCGSGCIFSSADDMTKWMRYLLGKINGLKSPILPWSATTNLFLPRSLLLNSASSRIEKPVFPVTFSSDLYALGLRVGHYRGHPIIMHTGSTPGYSSMLALVPSQNIGIFTVMNGDDDGYYFRKSLQSYIIDVMLGVEPWLNTSTICSFPQPWKAKHTSSLPVYDVNLKPVRAWVEYIGKYSNDGYGDIHVIFNTKLNGLVARYGIGYWRLYPQKMPDEFYGKGLEVTDFYDINPFLFDAQSPDGKITRLVVKGFSRSLPPVFDRVTETVDIIVG